MVSPRHRLDTDSDLDLVSASQFGTRERERETSIPGETRLADGQPGQQR